MNGRRCIRVNLRVVAGVEGDAGEDVAAAPRGAATQEQVHV